ncbi:hypothetical protein ACJMK2_008646 [Sinanodonta woodiana]|uniref:Cytochrome P450 n=1 Tax=Sinanodonta woodiana TaxID=1069815 RepID=A0ABD3VQ82_SINWO
MDLFLAGTETTSTTVNWASFYLATRPDIQSRIFEEIKGIVGTERLLSLQEKESCLRGGIHNGSLENEQHRYYQCTACSSN